MTQAKAQKNQRVLHPIPPLYDTDSKVLILGSFPSVKSREAAFFYGHPQNRFWRVISALYEEKVPETIDEKRSLILQNHLALWDVIQSCEITGSSDASIKNVIPNNLSVILQAAEIRAIFVNGKTAYKYYQKYTLPRIQRDAICLPSTSPANAAWSMERLVDAWKCIRF